MNEFHLEYLTITAGKLRKFMQRQFNEDLRSYDLRSVHSMYLLCLLKYPDGLTLKELTELNNVDKANTTRVIASLEVKGYIFKEFVTTGNCKYKILLTDSGIRAATAAEVCVKKNMDKFSAVITDEEKGIMVSVINKISKAAEL